MNFRRARFLLAAIGLVMAIAAGVLLMWPPAGDSARASGSERSARVLADRQISEVSAPAPPDGPTAGTKRSRRPAPEQAEWLRALRHEREEKLTALESLRAGGFGKKHPSVVASLKEIERLDERIWGLRDSGVDPIPEQPPVENGSVGYFGFSPDDEFRIRSVVPGGPAEAAGLQAGDIVVAVDGESLEGLALVAGLEVMRGPSGQAAKLKIRRPETGETFEAEVNRVPIDQLE